MPVFADVLAVRDRGAIGVGAHNRYAAFGMEGPALQSFFKGRTFQHDRFAEYLRRDSHVVKINGRLHIYQDGIYTPFQDAIEKAMIKEIPALKDSQRKETLKQLNLICDSRKPAPPEIIAFSNGLYDLRNDTFSDFTPDVVITNKIIPWTGSLAGNLKSGPCWKK